MNDSQSNYLRSVVISVLVFALTLVIYTSSRNTIPVADSRWAVYVALSIVKEGNTNLDEYAEVIAGTNNYGVEKVDGHLYSVFPLGTPLLAVPVLFAADKISQPLLALDLHEHMRVVHDKIASNLELLSAAIIAALSCVVIYWIGRLYLNITQALILVFIFAFGTSMWSTASRGLWQHGPSVLMLSTALYLLLAAKERPRLVQFASLPLAYAYVIRPTNSISILFITFYVFIAYRSFFLKYLFWAALIAIPFLLFNYRIYDNIFPPYYLPQRLELFSPALRAALIGNLFSPARGLLIYSPIFLLAGYGLFLKLRESQFGLLDAALICILLGHWLSISSFPQWDGGHAFGPRFFTDMLPYLMYFIIPVLAIIPSPLELHALPLSILLTVLVLLSFITHLRGATQPRAAFEWNWGFENIVEDINQDPQRVWDWSDPQFLRGLRPARLAALEPAPFLVVEENQKALLQVTVINAGDQELNLAFETPFRINFVAQDGPLSGELAGMSSQVLTFSIDTNGVHPGEYSLGGIQITGQNHSGSSSRGSPLVIPVSIKILSQPSFSPSQFTDNSRLPIVLRSEIVLERFVPPVDILLDGKAQTGQAQALRALFGSGWYDLENLADHHWRWAKSPAEIAVYSPSAQVVQISSTVVALPPKHTAREGEQGLFSLTTNGQKSTELPVKKNQPFTLETELKPGWNMITLTLADGNFIPAEGDPNSGDARKLSFALDKIDIVSQTQPADSSEHYP